MQKPQEPEKGHWEAPPAHRKPGVVSCFRLPLPVLVPRPGTHCCQGQRKTLCSCWGSSDLGNEHCHVFTDLLSRNLKGMIYKQNLFIYIFSFSGRTCSLWTLPGSGSNWSCSCKLHHSRSNTKSEPHQQPTLQLAAMPGP